MSNKSDFKFGFQKLAQKSLAVITASLGILTNNQSKAFPPSIHSSNYGNSFPLENAVKRILKPKLVLKLNMSDPANSIYASHASHSSHASHASHASHYSGSASNNDENDNDSGGGNSLWIAGGGALAAYGIYRLVKNNKKKQ